MSPRDAFGPNLRRIRLQRGVSLETIARTTKVSVDLWEALERNDFDRWPAGIYARGYVRSYAEAIGVDPDTTVDDFCRWFPLGDRRAARLVRGQAEIIGHDHLEWRDDLDSLPADRREAGSAPRPAPTLVARAVSVVAGWLLRALEGGVDAGAVREFLKRRHLAVSQREHHHEV